MEVHTYSQERQERTLKATRYCRTRREGGRVAGLDGVDVSGWEAAGAAGVCLVDMVEEG